MIKWKQQADGLEDFGLDFSNPDFVKFAESFGAKGLRVQQAADFANILSAALDSVGINLIEVPIDYSENDRVLTRELKSKTCLL
jgi:acetolactate synthase-1/2/3 large subunit